MRQELLEQIDKLTGSIDMTEEHDEMTPATLSTFVKNTPGAKFKSYKNASHTPHMESRSEFIQDMREFISLSDARN